MKLIALLKPGISVGVVGGGTAMATSLGVYGDVVFGYGSQSDNDDGSIDRASAWDDIPEGATKHNYAIFEEVSAALTNQTPSSGQTKVKCKLEGGTHQELCALSKVTKASNGDKNWIDLNQVKNNNTTGLVPEDFITEDPTIYSVKLTSTLINEWQANTTKKLNIFRGENITDETKPWTTLIPKFAIKNGNALRGPFQYMLGKATGFTVLGSAGNETKRNRSFKCSVPVVNDKKPAHKNCEIYHFNEHQKDTDLYTSLNLDLPLIKANEFGLSKYYLIKLQEAAQVNDASYSGNNIRIEVDVYDGWKREEAASVGIMDMSFEFITPVFVFKGTETVDLVVLTK